MPTFRSGRRGAIKVHREKVERKIEDSGVLETRYRKCVWTRG